MKTIKAILLGLAIVLTLGIAGKYDWASEVCYTMERNTYNEISKKLNTHNEIKIAEYYVEHYTERNR